MRDLMGVIGCVAVLAMGCDGEAVGETAPGEGEGERGRGKAEAPGSCLPEDCGAQASVGSCYCDDPCFGFGDCCMNKAVVCDGAAPPTGSGDSQPWSFADVIGPPNMDDDDAHGIHDFLQTVFPADDEMYDLVLPAAVLSTLAEGDEMQLALSGDVDRIRVWHEGEPAVGASAGTSFHAFVPDGGDEVLTVEFGDYGASGSLQIRHVRADGSVAAVDDVVLHAAPLLLNHHLQPAETVVAVRVNEPGYDNRAFLDAFASVLGDSFVTVRGRDWDFDVWIQDELEFASATGPFGKRLDVVVDSIRDRGLDGWAQAALEGPDVVVQAWGDPWNATTFDSFGNLEASPPVTVGGVAFPFGRIYYGRRGTTGLDAELASFLASQEVQAPFAIDTTWLCVGHVDEVVSFVPAPGSAKGWKLLLADVDAAIDLLESLPPGTSLPLYAYDHGWATVGEMLDDAALMADNLDIQADRLDEMRAVFVKELGLSNSDIVRVPSLFEHHAGCGAAALVPAMVNLVVAEHGDDIHVFVADPFFRSDLDDLGDDPFVERFAALMPAGLRLHFVDDWDVYHLGTGEVHCGTNVIRTPQGSWWTEATHLMGGI